MGSGETFLLKNLPGQKIQVKKSNTTINKVNQSHVTMNNNNQNQAVTCGCVTMGNNNQQNQAVTCCCVTMNNNNQQNQSSHMLLCDYEQ